jgi:hypothetical protein
MQAITTDHADPNAIYGFADQRTPHLEPHP